jgi:hypothetical protein
VAGRASSRGSRLLKLGQHMSDTDRDLILDEVTTFLRSLDSSERRGPATLLYNEGWLLRLVLSAEARGIHCLPQPFEPGAQWFTEALLYTRCLCTARLSSTTTSPGRRAGAKTCSTYA